MHSKTPKNEKLTFLGCAKEKNKKYDDNISVAEVIHKFYKGHNLEISQNFCATQQNFKKAATTYKTLKNIFRILKNSH